MAGTADSETPGTGGDQGTRRVASGPGDGHRRHHSGSRARSRRVEPEPPDLGALAKDAVISFLHDASTATAERAATRAETAAAGTSAAAGRRFCVFFSPHRLTKASRSRSRTYCSGTL